ncbi:MAG: prepilin-type N-terminal cleavage/methylation domain-containing protein [Planctomycetota bacterium]
MLNLTSEQFRRAAGRRRNAFTLIELIVVISIITLLVVLSFPYIRGMLRSSSEQMAANSISNAVQAARAYSTRYRPFIAPFQGRTSEDDGDGYSGAAVIVTSANELRVSENDELAENNGIRLEVPGFGSAIFNGYKPIGDLDDLLLPRNVAVLGIRRTAANEIELLPPPFAVAFSRRGELMTQSADLSNASSGAGAIARSVRRSDGFVYYDGNGDGNWGLQVTAGDDWDRVWADRDSFADNAGRTLEPYRRGGEAGKVEFDDLPNDVQNAASSGNPDVQSLYTDRGFMEGRWKLPFEKLEPVVGIAVFQPDRVPGRFLINSDDEADINADLPANEIQQFHPQRARRILIELDNNPDDDDNLLAWLTSSGGGEVLFFNRRTGAELRR